MPIRSTVLALLALAAVPLGAAEWHVAGTGSDANSGHSDGEAFATLQKAAEVAAPGDTVLIGDGTYEGNPTNPEQETLRITKSGTPDAWITWKAKPGHKPVLRGENWAIIRVLASYQIFEGLTIIGPNDSIALVEALAAAKAGKPNGRYSVGGIHIDGRKLPPAAKQHHITVRGCSIGKCSGGGVGLMDADYLTVEDCQIFDNCWFSPYAGSGISTNEIWPFDDNPGYHIIIQRNLVWNNRTMVPWGKIGKLSDGNGIILDVTDKKKNGPTNPNEDPVVKAEREEKEKVQNARPDWVGRYLVANNVSCYNGGSGIHCFRTSGADIFNNTTFMNGQVVGYPELFSNNSRDVRIFNNIMIPRPGAKLPIRYDKPDILFDYNVYPAGQDGVGGANDIVADPMFVNPQRDPSYGDFRLLPGSPAIDSGSDLLPLANDHLGLPRPAGVSRDRGAYEMPVRTP